MLYVNTGRAPARPVAAGPHAVGELADAIWIDLLRPDDAERSLVERATGLRVPAAAEIAEIESSSRLGSENGVLFLSTPMAFLDADGVSRVGALGFVLSDRMLLTVRYDEMPVVELFEGRLAVQPVPPSSAGAFVGLLEAIVDRLADVLEHVGADLDTLSRRVFRPEKAGRNAAKEDAKLRATLREVGRAGERLSNLRSSLLGVQRIASYARQVAAWLPAEAQPRLQVLHGDTASLAEFDAQLSNKVQFLLDATLGFINIEQNNGIKVLTVVSVVGVPPTLIASIYGMNFKWIPELQWEYGYFYGLAVIVLSGVLPLVWFKKRGWI